MSAVETRARGVSRPSQWEDEQRLGLGLGGGEQVGKMRGRDMAG